MELIQCALQILFVPSIRITKKNYHLNQLSFDYLKQDIFPQWPQEMTASVGGTFLIMESPNKTTCLIPANIKGMLKFNT